MGMKPWTVEVEVRTLGLVACVLGGLGSSVPAQGQVFSGEVVEEITGRAIEGAAVSVVDSMGIVVSITVSGEEGRFAVAAPSQGRYVLLVSMDEFQSLVSPSIPLRVGEEIELDLELIPIPIELPGLEVTVDPLQRARQELANRGIRLEDLGQRFIDEEEVDRRFSARDIGDVITARGLPGIHMIRPENVGGSGGDRFLCVAQQRARTGSGMTRCSLVILDGRAVPLKMAIDIPISYIKAVVVLRPVEATLVYGTIGGGGALLLFTKSNTRR
jgi:Carboxypeptidase regulatory-like domain